jgi:mannosyltransferase OCH1-like enzyme
MTIPKIIHQIWYQGVHNIPKKYYPNIASVQKYCPDWEYRCWNSVEIANECKKFSEECYNCFNNYKYMHQKIDLAKYVLLHNYGGIYIDIDCEVLKPLDQLPGLEDKELIVSKNSTNFLENMIANMSMEGNLINNGVILSSPNNKYIRSILNNVVNIKNGSKSLMNSKEICIMKTTGPVKFTKEINKFKNDPNILILDYYYFEPCYSYDKYCKVNNKSFINHKHAQTWVSDKFTNIFSIYFFIKEYILAIMLIMFIIYHYKY